MLFSRPSPHRPAPFNRLIPQHMPTQPRPTLGQQSTESSSHVSYHSITSSNSHLIYADDSLPENAGLLPDIIDRPIVSVYMSCQHLLTRLSPDIHHRLINSLHEPYLIDKKTWGFYPSPASTFARTSRYVFASTIMLQPRLSSDGFLPCHSSKGQPGTPVGFSFDSLLFCSRLAFRFFLHILPIFHTDKNTSRHPSHM